MLFKKVGVQFKIKPLKNMKNDNLPTYEYIEINFLHEMKIWTIYADNEDIECNLRRTQLHVWICIERFPFHFNELCF